VLFSRGCKFGGHSPYLLSAAFEREGTDMPTHGTLTLLERKPWP
jgi:hypothetical protein